MALFAGFCTAAHASDVEWLMIMGIESSANDIQSSNNNWKEIASVRAASVVDKILRDSLIFQDWPHSNAGITSFFSLFRETSNFYLPVAYSCMYCK